MEEERIINIERWDYALPGDNDRVKNLKAAACFKKITAEIKAEIKKEIKVLCFHPDPCKDDEQFKRFAYSILVGKKLFDWFYNSVNGYRAAYLRSPYDGSKANEHFIQSLIPELLASDKTTPNADKKLIQESLKSPSAKAWLVEDKGFRNPDGKTCKICKEWTPPKDNNAEILTNKWEYAVEPSYGRKAPYLTKIRIIGAFLNDNYDVFIPASKRNRANEIHEKGWS